MEDSDRVMCISGIEGKLDPLVEWNRLKLPEPFVQSYSRNSTNPDRRPAPITNCYHYNAFPALLTTRSLPNAPERYSSLVISKKAVAPMFPQVVAFQFLMSMKFAKPMTWQVAQRWPTSAIAHAIKKFLTTTGSEVK